MSNANKTGLVVTAHPGDFVWRAGGAIALHARRVTASRSPACRSASAAKASSPGRNRRDTGKGEGRPTRRGAAGRRDARRGNRVLRCRRLSAAPHEAHFDRMVDIYRELNPSFVLTHSLEDPYNVDHPSGAHIAQETRVVGQAMGHKPGAKYSLCRAAGVPIRAASAGDVQFQAAGDPQHRRGLGTEAPDVRDDRSPKASVGLLR